MATKASTQPRKCRLDGNTGNKEQGLAWLHRLAHFWVRMWYRFKNIFSSLKSYDLLSPDLTVRRQVKQFLRHRPHLGLSEWFEAFCKPRQIAYPVVNFLYTHLESYSGIGLGKLIPSDRLEEDLHWSAVCDVDWEIALCDDFLQQFGIDLSAYIEEANPVTIEDLVWLLHQGFQQHP